MIINKNLEKKEIYGDLIFSTKHWELFLAPSQTYLGTSVLAIKRESIGLRNLKKEEWDEFIELNKIIELNWIKTFKVTLFNWASADNASYRDNKNNKHSVHWHIHPRYKNPVEFIGMKFEDKEFGYPPEPKPTDLSEDMRKKIINSIKENF